MRYQPGIAISATFLAFTFGFADDAPARKKQEGCPIHTETTWHWATDEHGHRICVEDTLYVDCNGDLVIRPGTPMSKVRKVSKKLCGDVLE